MRSLLDGFLAREPLDALEAMALNALFAKHQDEGRGALVLGDLPRNRALVYVQGPTPTCSELWVRGGVTPPHRVSDAVDTPEIVGVLLLLDRRLCR